DPGLALGDLGGPDVAYQHDLGALGAWALLGHDGDGRVAPLGFDDVVDGAELVRTVGDGERVAFFVEVAVWHAVDVAGELRDALAGLLAAHAGVGDAGGVVGA